MTNTQVSTTLFSSFAYKPTTCQAKALYLLEEFLDNPAKQKVFMLKGSAGTGKTTLMQALVSYLADSAFHIELLAPTGKATKVLTKRSKSLATTIHHLLYLPVELEDGRIFYHYRPNLCKIRTVYVVDEASMLPSVATNDGLFFAENALLNDLLRHAEEGHPDNQIIFVGDTYQLEPIGETESVALSEQLFRKKFDLHVASTMLQEVMRQATGSPIIGLANRVKDLKDKDLPLKSQFLPLPRLRSESEAVHYFMTFFEAPQPENVIFLALSNEKVHHLNQTVREQIGVSALPLAKGDLVYLDATWSNSAHHIVRGETGLVVGVGGKVEVRANLRFIEAEIAFRNMNNEWFKVQAHLMLDYLTAEKPMIAQEQMKYLKADRMSNNKTYRSTERASDDPYMSAMRLRYGYALTGHKAQGSEWERVLIDPRFHLGNGHRWLYTAITRAKEEVWSWWY